MRLSYDPIYDSGATGILLTIVVIALLFWIMPSGVSRSRRRILLAMRGIAAVMLVLALLRPAFVRKDNRPTAATLAIAFDTSRSMTLGSGDPSANLLDPAAAQPTGIGGAESRWQQQHRALAEIARELSSFDENLNVALYRFDAASEQIALGPANDLSRSIGQFENAQPDGRLTNLAAPLDAAVATSRTQPLAGIVLFSDGTQTMQADAVQSVDPVSSANWVAAIGVPLWTVALGPPAMSSQLRDVAITSLPESYRMFTGNETEVSFEFQSRGYESAPIGLSLVWVDEAGQQSTAATRTITPNRDEYREAVRIPVVAPDPGQYRLVVSTRSLPGETDTTNDQQLSFVDVREGGGRVLYLEGTPRLEQRYLRRALRRFPDLELTYRWIPRDTTSRWPVDLSDDLQPGQFDVIILGDLHSAAIGNEQLSQIAELVANGTALLTLGGERAYGPGGYADTPLSPIVPVKMDASVSQPPGETLGESVPPGQTNPEDVVLPGQLAGPVALQIATPHPITRIDVDASKSVEDAWANLPPMPGANRFAGVQVAPGVQVLLHGGLKDGTAPPMMVVGEYGRGRVASLAFDSTWIWWTSGASEVHRRFWRQLMLWLLSREESSDGEIELTMTHRRMSTSETTLFTATRIGGEAATPESAVWTAEIVTESGDVTPLKLSTTKRGGIDDSRTEAAGEITGIAAGGGGDNQSGGLAAGIYRLRVRLGEKNDELATAELPFLVSDDTRELAAQNADHALLNRLALVTEAAGGESFRSDQVAELVDRIMTQRRRAERVIIEKWRLGDNPLSGWIMFTLFAGCLCCEWTLRRRWGLA